MPESETAEERGKAVKEVRMGSEREVPFVGERGRKEEEEEGAEATSLEIGEVEELEGDRVVEGVLVVAEEDFSS
jgi:hypothetical protein